MFSSFLLVSSSLMANYFELRNDTTYFDGQIERYIFDSFADHSSETKFFVRDAQNEKIEVHFDSSVDTHLIRSGLNVQLQGSMSNGIYSVDNANIAEDDLLNMFISKAIYNRSLMIVRLNFTGFSPSKSQLTHQEAKEQFDITNKTYQEGTWGQIQFDLDKDNDGEDDIVEVTVPFSGNCYSGDTWLAKAAPKIMSEHGLDVNTYNHIVVITPVLSSICGGTGGYAMVGSLNSSKTMAAYFVRRFSPAGHGIVMPHELGHSVGLLHAGQGEFQYGDKSSFMGNGVITSSFNSVNVNDLRSFDRFDHAQVVIDSGVYTLSPLRQDPAFADSTQILKVFRNNTYDNVYLSFRNSDHLDGNLSSTYINQVHFHQQYERTHSQNGSPSSSSIIRRTLEQGETYARSGVEVNVIEIAPDNSYAKVEVIVDGQRSSSSNAAPIAHEATHYAVSNQDTVFGLDYTDENYGPGVYSFTVSQQTQFGSLKSDNRKQTYTPDDDFIGMDRLEWSVNDSLEDSDTAIAFIKVLPSDQISDNFKNFELEVDISDKANTVEFNIDSIPSNSYSNCKIIYGDGSDMQDCEGALNYIYSEEGLYDACVLLQDSDDAYDLLCSEINIDSISAKQNGTRKIFNSFISSNVFNCKSGQANHFILLSIVLLLNVFYFRKKHLKIS